MYMIGKWPAEGWVIGQPLQNPDLHERGLPICGTNKIELSIYAQFLYVEQSVRLVIAYKALTLTLPCTSARA
jgi:hypothetical protein